MATAHEIIRKAYETQPHLRLAVNREENCIGSWSESAGRFVVVACKTIFPNDPWVEMPYELLINGKRIEHEWTEVPR
jgi:hypothetical protein